MDFEEIYKKQIYSKGKAQTMKERDQPTPMEYITKQEI